MRRRPPLHTDEEGVAGVVGAMLMAVVIVIILALIHREYVPTWIRENEAEHMNVLDNQFSECKAKIDNQILTGNTNLTLYSAFTLGNDGIPFFAPPTTGTLFINSFANSMVIASGDQSVHLNATGNLFFDALNHQYKDQKRGYEFGALLLNQSSGSSLVTTGPSFTVDNSSGVVNVTLTAVTLNGPDRSISGVDTEGIRTTLNIYQQDSYSWVGGSSLTLTLTTQFPTAWQNYYNTILGQELGDTAYTVTMNGSVVTVTINPVHNLDLGLAGLDVSFNI